MGVLHKLVYILSKLDERNEKWRDIQIERVQVTIFAAEKIDDATIRESAITDLQKQITSIHSAFADNEHDYGRKLYLIENCLYGVDIQPIAIQITKLRFFISLVCDQKTNRNKKDNHGIRFQSPKILMRRTDDTLRSCIENDSAICVNSCHVIKLNPQSEGHFSMPFLVGVLNAKLTQYVFKIQNPQMIAKTFAEVKVIYVERLFIPTVSPAQKIPLELLVERILTAKQTNPAADTSALEREIDPQVYALYGLTPEEIAIVESTAP